MKIYSSTPYNLSAGIPQIAANFTKLKVEVVYMDEAARNTKEWKAKNSTNRFPLLETDDGQIIFESSAISSFFARADPDSGLYGQTPFQAAQVDSMIAFLQQEVFTFKQYLYGILGIPGFPQSELLHSESIAAIKKHAKQMDKHLNGKSFLVGDSFTIADIVAIAYYQLLFQCHFDAGFRKTIPNLTGYFVRCTALPSVVKTLGYLKMCEKAMKAYDPNAKPEPVAAAPAKKEEPAADDDDLDLFGDDDGDEEAAKAIAEKAKKDGKDKKKKAEKIAMSLVLLEVKPLDDTIDLDVLAPKIFESVTQEGLFWKTEYQKEPVAFGIFKLIIGFSLEDEKVSVDDVVEKIEQMEDFVQSVEIAAFNKI